MSLLDTTSAPRSQVKAVDSLLASCRLAALHFAGRGSRLRVHTLLWCSASLKIKINYFGILFKGLFISKQALSCLNNLAGTNRNLKIWVMLDQKGPCCQRQNSVKARGQAAVLCALSLPRMFHCPSLPLTKKGLFSFRGVPGVYTQRRGSSAFL